MSCILTKTFKEKSNRFDRPIKKRLENVGEKHEGQNNNATRTT